MFVLKYFISLYILHSLYHPLQANKDNPLTRGITISNKCIHRLDVYWVPPDGGELVQQPNCPLVAGADMNLSSFVSHTFEVREIPSKKTGECSGEDKVCAVAYFTVNHNQDQVIYIKPGMEIEHIDIEVKALDEALNIMKQCEEKSRSFIKSETELTSDVTKKTIDELLSCIEQSTNDSVSEASSDMKYQNNLRKKIYKNVLNANANFMKMLQLNKN